MTTATDDRAALLAELDAAVQCVVSVSGGLGSAIALVRCIERFGEENVHPVFGDTRSEDGDLYRFLDDVDSLTGVPVVRLSDGRDIWDVFDQHRMISVKAAGGACKASIELKIKPCAKWVRERFGPHECVIATGIDPTEEDRAKRMDARWAPYKCVHPLFDSPWLSACQQQEFFRERGIEPPRLYAKGYPHNNCGGCCVLAGMKQWAGTLTDFPGRFAYHEERERKFFEETGFSVLRDRRGGESKPYPLHALREDVENGRADLTDDWRRQSCGCSLLEEQLTFWDLLDEVDCI